MSNPRDVVVLVGSLRKEAYSRKLAKALIALAPPQLRLEIVEIGELQLYNQDLEDKPPQPWTTFRDRVRRADAVLFVTPEYNRSVPAPLKNAIDVGSRPYGSSVWDGKPGGIVSASPGAVGGFGANQHLRQSMVFLNVPMLQQPEAYISGVDKLVDGEGGITNESTKGFLGKYLTAFASWIERTAPR